ncbi:phycobilisome rod-core linker polypeptide [Calothrix sp. UHCC 0171]|uniref:phycobilisome rod-core linker polypeptide n=1 Tax=Calothrix sp. UHCC 0171 TaxID=3110245 RepID=UPI002B2041C0|nr:phycobilisome rod-core linker polypeptide [Calothrix sp. UHCC 0171]MEA5570739.1 phycobilisome rod-core linker polypeptide [Calothrix sp. UHCC 0171]
MALPLLTYSPSSQNQRVKGFEVPGEEQPRIYTTENIPNSGNIDELIWAAYYQVFHEQQMLASNRQPYLESQLKAGQITVRDFIRGLATSDSFRRLNYDSNNNYRFVEICIQRLLGRPVYSDRETLAWSIVLATKGLKGLIDELLNTQEYLDNFNLDIVPYQRRRILPKQTQGSLPFARIARYGEDYRDKLPKSILGNRPPLTLQSFLRSSDRDVVLWILASTVVLIASLYLLPQLGLLPQIGMY